MLDLIWLIPLAPLVGVAINGLWGRRLPLRAVGAIASLTVAVSLLLSIGAVWQLSSLPEGARFHAVSLGTWLPLENLHVAWGFAIDPLSAVMVLVVSGVGFLIHVYSIGYMAHEPDYARFFTYMNLFMAMMLTLVLGDNMLVMFVGWEGVGLCSYLLIGFFYDRPFDARTGLSCADAGRKAFVTNRIGDFAFLIGVLYLAVSYGTLNFASISEAVRHADPASHGMLVAVGILLFLGACGKSAQIPLYVWLPDAMAGPTPVSALIHAATMVTAGVYMVTRMSALYAAAPEAMAVVAAVGALTAIFAATMGITARDIKKILAYSTVSQLGYMFAACGVGAYVAGIFHLMTHAFFKALLFLGAGSVIHGMSDEQDVTKMGGLKAKMPVTFWTMMMATLAISGIPGFAGFFSKDEILAGAWSAGNVWVWGILAAAAGITAFYMFRLIALTFWGKFRGTDEQEHHVHESPMLMTVPLVILAILSVVGGWIGIPAVLTGGADVNLFHRWLAPAITLPGAAHGAAEAAGHGAEAAHSAATEWGLIGLAVAIALVGVFLAVGLYRRGQEAAGRIAASVRPLYNLLRNLYWVDEFYDLVVLRPFYRLSRFSAAFDRWVVDGLVNASGITMDITGQIVKLFQTGYVRNYALMFLFGVVVILAYLVSM